MFILLFSIIINISTNIWAQGGTTKNAQGAALLSGGSAVAAGANTMLQGQQMANMQAQANNKEADAKRQEAKKNRDAAKENNDKAKVTRDELKDRNAGVAVCGKEDKNPMAINDVTAGNKDIATKLVALRATCQDTRAVPDATVPLENVLNSLNASSDPACKKDIAILRSERDNKVLSDYKTKCKEVIALEAKAAAQISEAERLEKEAGNLSSSSTAWGSVVMGVGQAALGLTGAVLQYNAAKDQEAWNKEQERLKNAEKCEVRCPTLFASGTPEYRRCVCAGGCGYQYNCNDTPCEEQYKEIDDKTMQSMMVLVCKCQKGGLKYDETTKKCTDGTTKQVNPLAIEPSNFRKDEPDTTKPATSLAGNPAKPGSASGAPSGSKGSVSAPGLTGSGATNAPAAVKANSQNDTGRVTGSGYADFGGQRRDSDYSGAGLGSKIDLHATTTAKPLDIETATDSSALALVTKVYQTGIQANRFEMLADSAKTTKVIKKKRRS